MHDLPEIIHSVTVTAPASDGRGIARYNGIPLFVSGALPGQTVSVRITSRKKRFAEAVAERLIAPAPNERPAPCVHADICGGCPWQKIPYTYQLAWKEDIVRNALTRIGHFENPPVHPAVPAPEEWTYRNKMEFAFGTDTEGNLTLGQRERRSHRVFDIAECLMQDRFSMHIVSVARQYAASKNTLVKKQNRSDEFWRYLVVRRPRSGGCVAELIVNPARAAYAFNPAEIAETLFNAVNNDQTFRLNLDGVVVSSRTAVSDVAIGEKTLACAGNTALIELINRPSALFNNNQKQLALKFDHTSFLQVNTYAAELLYGKAAELLAQKPIDTLWDLYCGVGSIGLFLAPLAQRVHGVEIIEPAIRYAQENARNAALPHCTFSAGDADTAFKLIKKEGFSDNSVLVVDPPRAGLSERVTVHLIEHCPPRLLYISCNPATLARDLARLSSSFILEKAVPVDLFPQTPHIETVCLLTKR